MKVRKTKSGQATNELYVSNCAHWDRLQFLAGVIQAAKSRDNLNSSENSKNSTSFEEDDSFLPEEDSFENETTCSKRVMVKNKKTKLSAAPYEEKKMELLAECTKLMREKPEEQQKCSKFAAFIDEKLESFDKGRRSYAEKRILLSFYRE